MVRCPPATASPPVETLTQPAQAEHACGGRGKVQAGMMPASASAPDVDELHLGSSVHSGPPARSSSDRVSAGCRGQSANQQGRVAWARMPWHATACRLERVSAPLPIPASRHSNPQQLRVRACRGTGPSVVPSPHLHSAHTTAESPGPEIQKSFSLQRQKQNTPSRKKTSALKPQGRAAQLHTRD